MKESEEAQITHRILIEKVHKYQPLKSLRYRWRISEWILEKYIFV
jgi:hypothetical protein